MHIKIPGLLALLTIAVALGCADNQPFVSLSNPLPHTQGTKAPTGTPGTNTNPNQITGVIPLASASPTVTADPTPGPTATPLLVTAVTISPASATLGLPDSASGSPVLPTTVQLSALVYLSDGTSTDSVSWSTDAPAVVGVSTGGLVSALATGSAHVFARAVANPSYTATATLAVQASGVVGITID